MLENVKYLDEDAFDTDSNLLNELIQHEGFQGKSLGIVLISGNNKCKLCGGNLLVRADRPSFPVVYSNDLGTVSGTHFRKYCQNNWKGCPFTQHYGFHTEGNESEVVYDDDFSQLPYFVSSHMAVFQTKLLSHLTAEMLLATISQYLGVSLCKVTAAKKSLLRTDTSLLIAQVSCSILIVLH